MRNWWQSTQVFQGKDTTRTGRRECLNGRGKAHLREYRDTLGLEDFINLSDLLMENGKYEESGFTIRFMNLFKKEFSRSTFDRIGNWFEGKVRNWAISDSVCGDLLAPMLANSIVSLEDFRPWRESADRWKMRAVPVSMLIVLKSPFDPNELLEFIRP